VSDITIDGNPTAGTTTDVQASGEGVLGPAGADLGGGASSGGLAFGGKLAQPVASIPQAIVAAGNAVTGGVNSVGNTIGGYVSSTLAAMEGLFLRGGVMFLAVIMLLAAAWLMVPRETKAAVARSVIK
jgi:hypothetical protein